MLNFTDDKFTYINEFNIMYDPTYYITMFPNGEKGRKNPYFLFHPEKNQGHRYFLLIDLLYIHFMPPKKYYYYEKA